MRWTPCSEGQVTIDRRQFLRAAGASLVAGQLGACGRSRSPVAGVPVSGFNDQSTAEEVTAGLNLKGKYAVVTGCTSGIGLETMRVLAARGAFVVGTSRSMARAEQACKSVVGITSPARLDLGDFESVVECAEHIRGMRIPIDMLICNAGYLGGGNDREIVHGVEKHFAVNHLGHFIFVNRVLDRLYIADQGRIVMTASRTAYTEAPEQGILFDDLTFNEEYSGLTAYGHSKLAIVLFSLALSKLLRGTRITTNSMHPGVIDTEIGRHFNPVMRFGLKLVAAVGGKTIEEGAATGCYLATSKALGAVSGQYFEDCNAVVVGGKNHLYNDAMAEQLMAVSEALTADYLVEQEGPQRRERPNAS